MPYTLRSHTAAAVRSGKVAPQAVLRRAGARFFGKILKLDAIVTLHALPRLPRPCHPRRPGPPARFAVVLLAVAAALRPAAAPPARAQSAGPDPAPVAGPAGSVYRRSAAPAAVPSVAVPSAAVPPVAVLPPVAGEPQDAKQAERIVAASLAGLGRVDSISARLRQRVRIGDRVLVGAGRYVQSGQGEDQRYRLESAMKSDTETFEVLEVCDGLFAWSYRRIGPQPAQIERFDVRRVRERLRALEVADDAPISPYLGGLQRTLSLIRDWFRFASVEPAAIDDMPVWTIVGRWNPDSLAAILPDRVEAARRPEGIAPEELPDGMPWCVRLSIGRRDLFPFRIEWLAIPGRRPVAPSPPEAIAVMELYEVRLGEPVDAAAFVYKPAAEDGLLDLTDTHVKALAPLRP